jgi:hypothetical protein
VAKVNDGKKAVAQADAKAKKEDKEAKGAKKDAKKSSAKADKDLEKMVKEGNEAIIAKAKAGTAKLKYEVGQIVTHSNGARSKVLKSGKWQFISGPTKKK